MKNMIKYIIWFCFLIYHALSEWKSLPTGHQIPVDTKIQFTKATDFQTTEILLVIPKPPTIVGCSLGRSFTCGINQLPKEFGMQKVIRHSSFVSGEHFLLSEQELEHCGPTPNGKLQCRTLETVTNTDEVIQLAVLPSNKISPWYYLLVISQEDILLVHVTDPKEPSQRIPFEKKILKYHGLLGNATDYFVVVEKQRGSISFQTELCLAPLWFDGEFSESLKLLCTEFEFKNDHEFIKSVLVHKKNLDLFSFAVVTSNNRLFYCELPTLSLVLICDTLIDDVKNQEVQIWSFTSLPQVDLQGNSDYLNWYDAFIYSQANEIKLLNLADRTLISIPVQEEIFVLYTNFQLKASSDKTDLQSLGTFTLLIITKQNSIQYCNIRKDWVDLDSNSLQRLLDKGDRIKEFSFQSILSRSNRVEFISLITQHKNIFKLNNLPLNFLAETSNNILKLNPGSQILWADTIIRPANKNGKYYMHNKQEEGQCWAAQTLGLLQFYKDDALQKEYPKACYIASDVFYPDKPKTFCCENLKSEERVKCINGGKYEHQNAVLKKINKQFADSDKGKPIQQLSQDLIINLLTNNMLISLDVAVINTTQTKPPPPIEYHTVTVIGVRKTNSENKMILEVIDTQVKEKVVLYIPLEEWYAWRFGPDLIWSLEKFNWVIPIVRGDSQIEEKKKRAEESLQDL